MNEHNKSLVIGVVIAAVLLVGGYFLYNNRNTTTLSPQNKSCISSQEAYNEIGKNTCVEYYVGYTSTSSRGNVFLDEKSNYTQGFTVTI